MSFPSSLPNTHIYRQCVFDGNLHHYIFQVSFIYFSILRNTVGIYQTCFPVPMMSACVRWAKEHVDEFNVILARQLGGLDESSNVRRECMERARTHAKMLTEVGLDFKDLIGKTVDDETNDQ
jgi:exocyst complex component 8